MNLKENYQQYQQIIEEKGITSLYHFTDRDNLKSIIEHGGLYSWADCEAKNIQIAKPGGDDLSRSLDRRDGLQNFVRVSFTQNHPMMYIAINQDRISNPVILKISPEVIYWQNSKFSDRNATRNGANVGGQLDDFKKIHFGSVRQKNHFDLDEDEQQYFQAEILVKNHIPLQYITNIEDFGIALPQKPLQAKIPYSAQITRANPTAFVFIVDHSASMNRTTTFEGERMMLAEAVSRIVNRQINELVSRCIKGNEIRHYYDIAVLGYGSDVYNGWLGNLVSQYFASPQQINDNPYEEIVTTKIVRTRKGETRKETREIQWFKARHDGRQTRMDLAFRKAKELLMPWISDHQDSYPPTIIHITDGEFVGTNYDKVIQEVDELKSMYTKDGNVLMFNIHVSPQEAEIVKFPTSRNEVASDKNSGNLYDFSSLLPLRYNAEIAKVRQDSDGNRHVAMAVNADMSLLIQIMDIGTPTPTPNINQ